MSLYDASKRREVRMWRKLYPPGIAALGIVLIIAAPLWLEIGLPDVVLLSALVGFLLIVAGIVIEAVQRIRR